MEKTAAVIVCAAGASRRFGGKKRKPFVQVGGRAAFLRSIEFFTERPDVKQIILAVAPADEELVKATYGPNLQFFGVQICHGGDHRSETVARAIEKVKDGIDLVAVHDAVRCCLKAEWVDRCMKKAAETGAAILACRVSDTIKRVQEGTVVQTVDRSDLWEAQTPQIFDVSILKKAYSMADGLGDVNISDDAQLVEAAGHRVSVVETDPSNVKITVGSDIAVAEAIIKSHPKPGPKGPVGPYYEAQW